jgi:UDP:flavonoid glycosyltransferase YjiC (YdhE family)
MVICHGGAGTTLGALTLGVALLILPQSADQYVIGAQVASSGAGLRLIPPEVNVDSIRESVLDPLHRTSYRRAARRIQAEIGAMHAPDDMVPVIEPIGERVGAFQAGSAVPPSTLYMPQRHRTLGLPIRRAAVRLPRP